MSPLVLIPLTAVYGALLVRLLIRIRDEKLGYGKEKTLCSLGFLALAACSALAGQRPLAFWQMLPALLCCLAGDVILALYNRSRRIPLFMAGLLSFLAGHFLFLWGLSRVRPMDWTTAAAALGGAVGVWALSRLPVLEMGRTLPWTMIYGAAVSALVGKAFRLMVSLGEPWCLWVLGGAALFWVSDLLILFLYFWPGRHPRIHAANLLTYYGGMALLAFSLAF